jgi:hypothetical protein
MWMPVEDERALDGVVTGAYPIGREQVIIPAPSAAAGEGRGIHRTKSTKPRPRASRAAALKWLNLKRFRACFSHRMVLIA